MKKIIIGTILLLSGIILYTAERFATLIFLHLESKYQELALLIQKIGSGTSIMAMILIGAGAYMLLREAASIYWKERKLL